jgi:hypothetical protein
MIERMLSWRKDGSGGVDHALFLGDLYVGGILQLQRNKKWRAWFMNDDGGNEVGRFETAFEARLAVESALLKALPNAVSLIVEASATS